MKGQEAVARTGGRHGSNENNGKAEGSRNEIRIQMKTIGKINNKGKEEKQRERIGVKD